MVKKQEKHTASRLRNILTRCHSSPSSLSARILSRFAASVSSQRSSSTKVSIDCKMYVYQIINGGEDAVFSPSYIVQLCLTLSTLKTIGPSCQQSVGLVLQYLPWTERFSTLLFALMMNVPVSQLIFMLQLNCHDSDTYFDCNCPD